MSDPTTFLTMIAALSAASQTLVEYVLKKPIDLFDKKGETTGAEKWRHFRVHLLVALIGGGLSVAAGLEPLSALGVARGPGANAVAAGILVSYSGSFFDEALGAVREFKKRTEELRINKGQ